MITIKFKTDKLKPELEKILDSAMDDIADLVVDKADETLNDPDPKVGAFDRGFLAASLVTDKDEFLNKEVGAEAPYAIWIEYGTDPHYPPLEPIYDWVWRKRNDLNIKYNENNKTIGFDGREYITEILRVAQNIIWKIGRQGTEPKPFLRPALQYGRKETKRIIEGKFR